MKLSFESFEFQLEVAERSKSTQPYEDWCRIIVRVVVPGFVGKFDWSATLGDLRRLDTILATIYDNLGAVASFTYEPVEPSVAFVFRPTVSGHIETDYVLEARLAWGPKLVGTFTFDQSYIPSMREQLGELLASAAV